MDKDEICGFRQSEEREGEIDFVLYYGTGVKESTRLLFQGLFEKFLSGRNVLVTRYPPVFCPNIECRCPQERTAVVRRILNKDGFMCCVNCGKKIILPKMGESIGLSREEEKVVLQQQTTAGERTKFEAVLVRFLSFVVGKETPPKKPGCFISYAWGNPQHERWVEKRLAVDLKNAGINVILDRWHNAEIGADVPRFISLIHDCDSIVVVGTPLYLKKYQNKNSYTGFVVAAEVDLINQRLTGTQEQKLTVRPVLLEGNKESSLPPLMQGKVYGDFTNESLYFKGLLDLIVSLYGIPFDNEVVARLREELYSEP